MKNVQIQTILRCTPDF